MEAKQSVNPCFTLKKGILQKVIIKFFYQLDLPYIEKGHTTKSYY